MIVRDWLKIGRRPTMRAILQEVAEETDISLDDLLGQSRLKGISHARQYAMWRIRRETNRSLPEIGAFLGGRDHTTVLHGVRMHEKRAAEAANWMLAA